MKKYKVSEFANLVDTTKDTLIYYDNIGVFSPNDRGLNGYRQYSRQQVEEFRRIQMFRNIGFTINEIKDFKNSSYEKEEVEKITSNLLEKIDEEIFVLESTKFLIKHRDCLYKHVEKLKLNVPKIMTVSNQRVVEFSEEITLNKINDAVETFTEVLKSQKIITSGVFGVKMKRERNTLFAVTKNKGTLIKGDKYINVLVNGNIRDSNAVISTFEDICKTANLEFADPLYLIFVGESMKIDGKDNMFLLISQSSEK